MTNVHYIEESNLSVAWGRAILEAMSSRSSEVAPLVVSITGFHDSGRVEENPVIRNALDAALVSNKKQAIDTVANTIFPISMWNPRAGRQQLFDRYSGIAPRLRQSSLKNRRGLYFERMINGGPSGKENQLKFGIETYMSRKGVRRSVLQLGIFNPSKDHSAAAYLGFPCLQHVTFAPTTEGLNVNAFYATQYLFERAYGNYLGLCRLGMFAAHEMGIPSRRLTCFTGIAEMDLGKGKFSRLATTIREEIEKKHAQA